MDDVIINKVAAIERCVARVREEYADSPRSLNDQTTQDSIILNLQRACETSIDLGMHLIRRQRLGVPQSSRDAFSFLADALIIPHDLSAALQRMVGFRNIAVHGYQDLNLTVVQSIVEERLEDVLRFARTALAMDKNP